MPLPNPGSDESREDWMGRCMGNEAMREEFPEQEQRAAVCMQKWRDRDEEKAAAEGEIQVKALESWEIKDESTGQIEAIVATLNVVDRDGEVITRDAIKSGAKVKMSAYAHDMVGGLFGGGGTLPAGKGAIYVEENRAVFRGKVFMSTERGRDVMEVLKEMGPDQEWSFGFRVVGSELPDDDWRKQGAELILTKLDVFEVSPVLVGAGIGTRTLAAKSRKAAALAEKARADAEVAEAAAKRVEKEAAATREAEEAAARAEAERQEAEKIAAEAEATRAEAERQAAAAEAARVEAEAEEEARRKERVQRDREEFERVQRSIKRMGLPPVTGR